MTIAHEKWLDGDSTIEEKRLFQGLVDDVMGVLELTEEDRECVDATLRVGKRKQIQLVEAVYGYLEDPYNDARENALDMIDLVRAMLALIKMNQK